MPTSKEMLSTKYFEQAYPGYQPKDLVDVDFIFRPGAVEQAKLKSAQQGAPVYMYMFAWESPVMDGILPMIAFRQKLTDASKWQNKQFLKKIKKTG